VLLAEFERKYGSDLAGMVRINNGVPADDQRTMMDMIHEHLGKEGKRPPKRLLSHLLVRLLGLQAAAGMLADGS
jgi:hypothetical protein